MDTKNIRLIAFDLDGTLTQHKSKLSQQNRGVLEKLAQKYRLVIAGAGMCRRIFEQLDRFPIDIIGNYGMQFAAYDAAVNDIILLKDATAPVDRESVESRISELRHKHGFTRFAGDNAEYHRSGCITFPLLGTKADIHDKLTFDPDRKIRRAFYAEVVSAFPEYTVFVGGSSSFDMAPFPYNKYYALDKYCRENNISHDRTVFVGDDYGMGGNDESVYKSDFNFVKIDDYRDLEKVMKQFI